MSFRYLHLTPVQKINNAGLTPDAKYKTEKKEMDAPES